MASTETAESVGRKVSLTGIKPTGEPHLGNFVGAIRPALALAHTYDSVYFIADYHALTTERDPAALRHYTRSVAATWLAAGLDPAQTLFYRQSDVPEITELTWILSCVTPKGLMNRAHAYKAARDRNITIGEDPDAGINMGVFNYPVLMAVDILIMGADVVPVGRDQQQHVEYAADIAAAFNHVYGAGYRFRIPVAIMPDGTTPALPGTDGRKMSKSYRNTIPLFAPPDQTRRTIRRIATDSLPVEAPKDPDTSAVFQLLAQVAEPEVTAEVAERLRTGGMGWAAVKDRLADAFEARFGGMRDHYDQLMARDSGLDDLLDSGGALARARAREVIDHVRAAVGVGAAR